MFLSIATTHEPASDFEWFLHKHPDRLQQAELDFGNAWLSYPETTAAYGYHPAFSDIKVDEALGAPTQMAVFAR